MLLLLKGLAFLSCQVCLAKANSASSLDAVVVQDLNLGEGQAVENGDSLEVVYTGWLLQNHTIGQVTPNPTLIIMHLCLESPVLLCFVHMMPHNSLTVQYGSRCLTLTRTKTSCYD